MSSILVLRQRKAVHLMCDMAAYEAVTGILHSVDLMKCVAMPSLMAAVSCTGPALLGAFFGERLPQLFRSFDDLVARGPALLPPLFEQFAAAERGGDASSSFFVVGWHKASRRPAAYCMEMWTDASTRIAQVLANSPNGAGLERFKFKEQLVAGTPLPGQDLLDAAGWSLPDDENDMDPKRDLLHLMEVQRHEEIEGRYWVGGGALLTSIDRKCITQRVVHRWEEDQVGEAIHPKPAAGRSK